MHSEPATLDLAPPAGLALRVPPRLLAWLPAAVLAAYVALLVSPRTGAFAVELVQENRPVELVTFVLLMAGGWLGLRLAAGLRRNGAPALVPVHYGLFGAGLLLIAMEEIAWGQQFLHFATPAPLEAINAQGEVTLHNIGPMQGRSEFFRLAFGVAGCVGLLLASQPLWSQVAVPRLLAPWFVLITLAAGLDTYNDFASLSLGMTGDQWRWLSEVVEMLIGAAGFLYVYLNGSQLRREAGPPPSAA